MSILAIDNETFLIQRDRPYPPVVCLSWATKFSDALDKVKAAVIPHGSVADYMARQLADTTQRFVGHNIAYDFCTIAASEPHLLVPIFGAYKAGRVTDTQLRQQLIMIAAKHIVGDDDAVRGYGLAALYHDIFDEPIPGPGGNKSAPEHVRYGYGRLYGVDFSEWPDEYIEYSREDSIAALRVHDAQQTKAGELLRDDAFQAYSAFVLSLVSANGLRTDPGRTAALKARKTAEAAALEPELVQSGMLEPKYKGRGEAKHQIGWTKKMNVARQRVLELAAARGVDALDPGRELAGILLTKTGRKLYRESKTVKLDHVSIDRTACNWTGDPALLRRAKYVSANKILETYVPALEKGFEYPITSRYGLAATGRTTAGTPSKPQEGTALQTMPRDPGVRECIIPREGKVFIMGDFDGAEMHTLAQVCKWRVGFSVLGDTMNAGRDPHVNTARYLLGGPTTPLDYDDLWACYKQGDPEAKGARQNAKPVNFGFGGFMHGPTFVATQFKEMLWTHNPDGTVTRKGKLWTLDEADQARAGWLAAYPEMPEYFASCKRELGPSGKCTVELYGSKRLRMVRGMPTICNSFFQALTADGAKKAINEVIRTCLCEPSSALYQNSTYGVNFVHDELIAETDDSDVDTLQVVAKEFGDIMVREFNELVPDYPTTVEVVLARYWSKGCEPTFDEQGRLIPWNG